MSPQNRIFGRQLHFFNLSGFLELVKPEFSFNSLVEDFVRDFLEEALVDLRLD
jgi:hypothetical protein